MVHGKSRLPIVHGVRLYCFRLVPRRAPAVTHTVSMPWLHAFNAGYSHKLSVSRQVNHGQRDGLGFGRSARSTIGEGAAPASWCAGRLVPALALCVSLACWLFNVSRSDDSDCLSTSGHSISPFSLPCQANVSRVPEPRGCTRALASCRSLQASCCRPRASSSRLVLVEVKG